MNHQIRQLSSVCAIVAAGLALAHPAIAEDWRDQANYPARVTSITFGTQVLAVGHPVKFGSWTVSFGPDGLPIFGKPFSPNSFTSMDVSGSTGHHAPLVCSNAVIGQAWCQMNLNSQGAQNPTESCNLATPSGFIPIACPTEIAFQG